VRKLDQIKPFHLYYIKDLSSILNSGRCQRLYWGPLNHSLDLVFHFLIYTLTFSFVLEGTISRDCDNKQVLDKLQVERERGITVKAQTASLFYNHEGETYLLNLIDTPVSVKQ